MDAGLTEKTDEEQLAFAIERECAGMMLAPQQRFSVGEQLRRILRLRASATMSSMRNQIEFLSNWG